MYYIAYLTCHKEAGVCVGGRGGGAIITNEEGSGLGEKKRIKKIVKLKNRLYHKHCNSCVYIFSIVNICINCFGHCAYFTKLFTSY